MLADEVRHALINEVFHLDNVANVYQPILRAKEINVLYLGFEI